MSDNHLRESGYRLLDIIWSREPLTSRELAEHAAERLGWSRTTTYTVLKKLVDDGYCANENARVRALIAREEVQRTDSERLVSSRFGGSLPKFITAFMDSRAMSKEEADEIIRLLEEYKGE